ncbi:class I SAM-dependent methyltransferase [Fibrobacterota bacterium]
MKFKNWRYHSLLVHHLSLSVYLKLFPKYLKKTVCDIGCGTKPYQDFILPHCDKNFGIDHVNSLHESDQVDVYATAYNTGLKSESVDVVFSSAVLEHLEEPGMFMSEAHRILKKDGTIIVGTPLFWHLHEKPRDFYRYTRYGLEYLLTKSNFKVEEIIPLSGFWVTFTAELVSYLARFNRSIIKIIPFIPVFCVAIQIAAWFLNIFDKRNSDWTWAYIAVGRKE